MDYPFFFSYAHNDFLVDKHVDVFYKEVSRWVRQLTGARVDGLIDTSGLRAGDVWDKKLGADLRKVGAAVCLYSPSYFSSKVCSQELEVFLHRRAKHKREHAGTPPAAIIPVLWVSHTVPISVPDFQYEHAKADDPAQQSIAYLAQFGDEKEFQQIAWRVAARIKEATRSDRVALDDLGFDPVLKGMGSAFEPQSLPPAAFGADARIGSECVTYVYAYPPPWNQWPFQPAAKTLLYTSAAVAKGRELSVYELTFDPSEPGLAGRMESVRIRDHAQVVLVDGSTLLNPAVVARLAEYDALGLDACATVIAWPPGSRTPAAEAAIDTAFPKQRLRQAPYFYRAVEASDDFAKAVADSLDALQNDIMGNRRSLPAQQPATSDFAKVPAVSGPGGQRAA
jgi:hypothetical protein